MTNNTNPPTVDIDSPTKAPQPKVVGAVSGAGVGAAAGTVAVYLIEELGRIDLPGTVEGAILVLVAAGLAFLGGYLPKLRVPAATARHSA